MITNLENEIPFHNFFPKKEVKCVFVYLYLKNLHNIKNDDLSTHIQYIQEIIYNLVEFTNGKVKLNSTSYLLLVWECEDLNNDAEYDVELQIALLTCV